MFGIRRHGLRKMLRRSAGAQRRTYVAPLRDMKFVINEVHDFDAHFEELDVKDQTEGMLDAVLDETAKISEELLVPLNEVADQEGCTHIGPTEVKTPTGFKDAYDVFVEGGWQGLSFPEQYGGMGMPYSFSLFQADILAAANWTWTMFPGLSKGAINTLLSHASEPLKDKFLNQLVSGEWTGTMCLTEPACGSDLGQVSTKAVPIDGETTECGMQKYKISGTKIFISCGDHDLTDNILHCVLARLPDAPAGTKGISLFAVPKKIVGADGSVGDLNNVNVGRIEDKMGCHGSPTCELNFDEAEGYLIGTENKGLNHMFTFINTSRLGTSVQGFAAAELAYQNALWYAKERLAMRSLTGKKNPDGPADPIIVHPAVRKMLLTMKAVSEGGRSMVYECAKLADHLQKAELAGDEKEASRIDDRMGFLTPILKGFLTEVGVEAANAGIQVYGGHGYIKSNKQEQVARDVRIAPVWEGTTQIQGLDLLGRKVLLQKLKPINEHCKILRNDAWEAITKGSGKIRSHGMSLMYHAMEWQLITYRIAAMAMKNKDQVGVAAEDYLMYGGYVNLAHHWLRMEQAADKALKGNAEDKQEDDFYHAKMQTSDFVYEHLLPRTKVLKKTMFSSPDILMNMKESSFSFDHSLA